jgi:hypothetical protein
VTDRIQELGQAIAKQERAGRKVEAIRIGRDAYEEVVMLAAGEPPPDLMMELDPERYRQAWQDREDRIVSGLKAWGRSGSSLFGYPLWCVDDLDGFGLVLKSLVDPAARIWHGVEEEA